MIDMVGLLNLFRSLYTPCLIVHLLWLLALFSEGTSAIPGQDSFAYLSYIPGEQNFTIFIYLVVFTKPSKKLIWKTILI